MNRARHNKGHKTIQTATKSYTNTLPVINEMKKILFLILIYSSTTFAQTKIDSIVSIKFPGEVKRLDITEKNISKVSYYSVNDKDSFAMSRIDSIGYKRENDLNFEQENLKDKHKKLVLSQIKAMYKKGFLFDDSYLIKINEFNGAKTVYINEKSGVKNAESIMFILNGVNYVATYSKVSEFSEERKNIFFNSLKIDKTKKEDEGINKDKFNLNNSILKLLGTGIILFLLIYYRKKTKKNYR